MGVDWTIDDPKKRLTANPLAIGGCPLRHVCDWQTGQVPTVSELPPIKLISKSYATGLWALGVTIFPAQF